MGAGRYCEPSTVANIKCGVQRSQHSLRLGRLALFCQPVDLVGCSGIKGAGSSAPGADPEQLWDPIELQLRTTTLILRAMVKITSSFYESQDGLTGYSIR
jgi:hypothetical protein